VYTQKMDDVNALRARNIELERELSALKFKAPTKSREQLRASITATETAIEVAEKNEEVVRKEMDDYETLRKKTARKLVLTVEERKFVEDATESIKILYSKLQDAKTQTKTLRSALSRLHGSLRKWDAYDAEQERLRALEMGSVYEEPAAIVIVPEKEPTPPRPDPVDQYFISIFGTANPELIPDFFRRLLLEIGVKLRGADVVEDGTIDRIIARWRTYVEGYFNKHGRFPNDSQVAANISIPGGQGYVFWKRLITHWNPPVPLVVVALPSPPRAIQLQFSTAYSKGTITQTFDGVDPRAPFAIVSPQRQHADFTAVLANKIHKNLSIEPVRQTFVASAEWIYAKMGPDPARITMILFELEQVSLLPLEGQGPDAVCTLKDRVWVSDHTVDDKVRYKVYMTTRACVANAGMRVTFVWSRSERTKKNTLLAIFVHSAKDVRVVESSTKKPRQIYTQIKECASCGAPDPRALCGGPCDSARYCGQKCAEHHWCEHEKDCLVKTK
jgi:hypothetical protein